MEKQLLDTFLDLCTYDIKMQEWSYEKYDNNPLKQELKKIEHVLHFESILQELSIHKKS